MLLAPVAQWIEQWFPVPCAGVRFPSGVLHGTMNSSDALYHKEDKNLDDFREWLSDNLRYFMLGGAILIIVLVLFFGVRACVGSNKGNSGDGQKTAAKTREMFLLLRQMKGSLTRRKKTPIPWKKQMQILLH